MYITKDGCFKDNIFYLVDIFPVHQFDNNKKGLLQEQLCIKWDDSIIKNYVHSLFNPPSKPELFVPQLDDTICV